MYLLSYEYILIDNNSFFSDVQKFESNKSDKQ